MKALYFRNLSLNIILVYLFRAYKKVANFYICEINIVVFCCTTKEDFKTKYESCSQILFLVQKKLIVANIFTCFVNSFIRIF